MTRTVIERIGDIQICTAKKKKRRATVLQRYTQKEKLEQWTKKRKTNEQTNNGSVDCKPMQRNNEI